MTLKSLFKNRPEQQPEQQMDPSSGFSILETIFGMFLFTVGILALASMQIHSLSANVNACNISKAMATGASLLSDLRPMNYSSTDLSGDSEEGQMHDSGTVDRYAVTYHVRRLEAFKGEAAVITANVAWSQQDRQRAETMHYFKIDEYGN